MSYARSIASVILIIFVCATYGFPQEQAVGSNTKPEDQVTQVERDWLAADAKGDVAWSTIRLKGTPSMESKGADEGLRSRPRYPPAMAPMTRIRQPYCCAKVSRNVEGVIW